MKRFCAALLCVVYASLQVAFAQTTVPLVNPQQLQIPATGVDLNNLINQINAALSKINVAGAPPLTVALGITASVASPPVLVNTYNQVTTCPVGAGVQLSIPASFASFVWVTNTTANGLTLLPYAGATINTFSNLEIGPGATIQIMEVSPTLIYTVPLT